MDAQNMSQEMMMNNQVSYNQYVQQCEQPTVPRILVPSKIAEIRSYSNGTVVQLPDFGPDQPFFARLKRPSMLVLVKNGKIPNALLSTANELFTNKAGIDTDNQNMMSDIFGVMDTICEASFVEPTYQQLKENGIELTDEQLMFVFNYSQKGIKALQSFREE